MDGQPAVYLCIAALEVNVLNCRDEVRGQGAYRAAEDPSQSASRAVAAASGDATARRSCRLGRSQRVTDSLKEAAHSPADLARRQIKVQGPPTGQIRMICADAAAAKDYNAPDIVTHSTLSQYCPSTAMTDLRRLPGRGYPLTIDSGWRQVADTALN
jgi:hypothetical protein